MFQRFEELPDSRFCGVSDFMSFSENATPALWSEFMPRRSELSAADHNLYSIEIYPDDFFHSFDPTRKFEKFAAVRVGEDATFPDGMNELVCPSGKYAVFLHRGTPAEGARTYGYIFNEWLPSSGLKLDNRPHFAVMGDKYVHDDPHSEEEIWIPICN